MRIAVLVLLFMSSLSGMVVAAPPPLVDGVRLSQRSQQATWVSHIGARLAATAPQPCLEWTFVLVEEKVPQAYAPGEGVVIVSEGLLDLQLDQDELAGILAHEMAHRLEGHIILERVPEANLRQIEEESTHLLAESAQARRNHWGGTRLLQLEQRARKLQEEHAVLAGFVNADRRSNHACELQADALGREHAAAAGYSRGGLESALRKLLFGCDSALTSESSTHPALALRIQILHGR